MKETTYILLILDKDNQVLVYKGVYPIAVSNQARQTVILKILNKHKLHLTWFQTRVNYKLYSISTPYLFTETRTTIQLCKEFNPKQELIEKHLVMELYQIP